ncbi:endonuclease/exonuclease/phosphatase family protein [Shewanella cyperi]|uniref:endonuclease/exonuclease/phosphatase family protein n=1 Tax=Shewanella cyperi TaxID=2814292 RepID=UPI001A93BBA0|nr:endonuclease/exonuclease/phosphatase family protein [Shewanella cyperi]QSX40095.1 endonuclease/exonuclease/phosphatase family protein [Shewanella cyperi]
MAPEGHEAARGQKAQIKLASLNLFNFIEPPLAAYEFDRIYSQEQWQKKCAWLRHCLSSLQADVLGLQEVFSPQALERLLGELNYPHFALVDTPAGDEHVLHSPVVALASRHPIVELAALQPEPKLLPLLGLAADFRFSRTVLRGTVRLPDLGKLDVYVVHLKSQRPGFELAELPAMTDNAVTDNALPEKNGANAHIARLLTHSALGRFSSTLRRGAEAMLLYHNVQSRRLERGNPFVILGDFNGELTRPEFAGLNTCAADVHPRDRAELTSLSEADFEAGAAAFALHDGAALFLHWLRQQSPGTDWQVRPTHYLGPRGSVLDHILLSAEFDGSLSSALADVVNFELFDEHLRAPLYERDSQSSDHAAVCVTLSPREKR